MADNVKLLGTDGIFDYPDSTGSTGTTEQTYIEWEKNHHTVLENAVRVSLWQPSTDYNVGDVVCSPNMKGNTIARVTTAGTSSTAEPAWVRAGNSMSDGTVTWLIMPRTLDFATDAEAKEGTASGTIISPATLKSALDVGLAKKVNIADYDVDKSATDTNLAKKLNIADLTPQKLWDVRHSLGKNYVPTDTTNAGWNALGLAISYYNTLGKISNQPSQYGQLINIPAAKDGVEATQMWIDQTNGAIYTRRGNTSDVINEQTFKKLAFEDGAGVVAGDVSNANAWWVKLGGTIPLIIQGGTNGAVRSSAGNTLTFPVAYSTANILVLATGWYGYNDNHAAIVHLNSVSNTGAALAGGLNDDDGGGYYQMAGRYSWIAIGY